MYLNLKSKQYSYFCLPYGDYDTGHGITLRVEDQYKQNGEDEVIDEAWNPHIVKMYIWEVQP